MSRLDCFKHFTKVASASFLGLVVFTVGLVADDNGGAELPPVPFGVTSFGAATADGNIYLYGGHTGRPHSYSVDGISEKLLCLNTKSKSPEWKEVSTGPKLQGLALVEHKGKLYRIGGLTIEAIDKVQSSVAGDEEEPEFSENETSTKSGHKIYSVDNVALFDPASSKWQDLPSLPEPRSSHDAVVVNDTIYVFGGWSLDDENENWAEHGFSLDLSKDKLKWETVKQPEACRRAVSVAALDGKIYMIGGMTEDSDILNEVVVYDIKTEKWDVVEDLPAKGRMAGFGNSSFAIGNKIYCLAYDGVLRAFAPASGKWSVVKESSERFFHRLLQLSDKQLVIVGGSDMKTGFVKATEVYNSEAKGKAATSNKADSAESKTLDSRLSALKSAGPDDYPKVIEDAIKQDIDRDELLKLLRKDINPVPGKERTGNLKKGWSQWEATDENGETRPYQIYASEKIAGGEKPKAVIVHLHGAVARPDFGTSMGGADSVGYAGFLWPKVADEHNYLIVCPLGRADCCWWLDTGVSHVKAVIRDVKRTLPIPDRAIYCSGFSDGASGCYYLSMAAPDPFAGFIAMNGHPSVASNVSQKQLYLRNMRYTPFVAAMTQNDSLYPTRTLLPHLNMAIRKGAPIWLISYANANHQPTYFDDQTTTIVNFFKNNKRPRSRDRIRWQASDIALGKAGWLEIKEIGETEYDAPVWEDLNLMTTPGRVNIGIELESFASAKVKRVVPDSGADSAGIQADDTILQLGETKLNGARDLRTALANFKFGQEFTCVVKRGDQEKTLSGTFPEFVPEKEYRRDNPAAQVDCRLTEEGKPRILFSSRNVKRARVWLTPEFATADEIEVVCGYKDDTQSKTFPVVRLTPEQLLKRYAENPDRTTTDRYVDIEL